MNSPYANVTWCDDVREEREEKLTLLGVYGAGLSLHRQSPWITRLFCVTGVHLPREYRFTTIDVKLSLHQPDSIQKLVTHTVPESATRRSIHPMHTARLVTDVENVQVTGTMRLCAEVCIDDDCLLVEYLYIYVE